MKLLIAIVLIADMVALGAIGSWNDTKIDTKWINTAEKSKCTNPFFTKGFTVFLDGKAYEIGFREDGTMVWRHP